MSNGLDYPGWAIARLNLCVSEAGFRVPHPPSTTQGGKSMVVLGLVLLVLGLVLSVPILVTIGAILLVVGLVLNFVPIGGSSRRVY